MTHDPRLDDSEYVYAGFWVRLGAYVVDSLIAMVLLAPFYYFEYQRWADVPIEQMPAYTVTDFVLTALIVLLVVWFWVKKGATLARCCLAYRFAILRRVSLSVLQRPYFVIWWATPSQPWCCVWALFGSLLIAQTRLA